MLLGCDPGLARIGLVLYDTEARRVVRAWQPKRTTLQVVRDAVGVAALGGMHLAVELPRIRGGHADKRGDVEYGTRIGHVAATLRQVGRILEHAETRCEMPADRIHLVDRTAVAKFFGVRSSDANVNAAVRRHLCGTDDMRRAKGTRLFPGPCHGVGGDAWAALAVAIVCAETRL